MVTTVKVQQHMPSSSDYDQLELLGRFPRFIDLLRIGVNQWIDLNQIDWSICRYFLSAFQVQCSSKTGVSCRFLNIGAFDFNRQLSKQIVRHFWIVHSSKASLLWHIFFQENPKRFNIENTLLQPSDSWFTKSFALSLLLCDPMG